MSEDSLEEFYANDSWIRDKGFKLTTEDKCISEYDGIRCKGLKYHLDYHHSLDRYKNFIQWNDDGEKLTYD